MHRFEVTFKETTTGAPPAIEALFLPHTRIGLWVPLPARRHAGRCRRDQVRDPQMPPDTTEPPDPPIHRRVAAKEEMRTCGVVRLGLIGIAVLALTAARAFAENTALIGHRGEVQLAGDTRVGSALLTAGRYQVQHQWIAGRHYLVVRSHGTPTGATDSQKAETSLEVARVACRVVPTTRRPGTGLFLTEGVDGISTLTRIGILDERRAHVLVLEPSS